ncbi:MAG: hypothetical protein H0U74_09100 [Bradymonadaceae bacterium]|nr:hypothetical protein [Lujinxingiaceae bacterium]
MALAACNPSEKIQAASVLAEATFIIDSGPLVRDLTMRTGFGIYTAASAGERVAVLFGSSLEGYVDHYDPGSGGFDGTTTTSSTSLQIALSEDGGKSWRMVPLPPNFPHGIPVRLHLYGGRIYMVGQRDGSRDVSSAIRTTTFALAELHLDEGRWGPVIGGIFGVTGGRMSIHGPHVRGFTQQVSGHGSDVGDPNSKLGDFFWQEVNLDTASFAEGARMYTYSERCDGSYEALGEGAAWGAFAECGTPFCRMTQRDGECTRHKREICQMGVWPQPLYASDPSPSGDSMLPRARACAPMAVWPAEASGYGATVLLAGPQHVEQAFVRDGHTYAARMIPAEEAEMRVWPQTCQISEQDPYGALWCASTGGICSLAVDCDLQPQACALPEPRCVEWVVPSKIVVSHLGQGRLAGSRQGRAGGTFMADLLVLKGPETFLPDGSLELAPEESRLVRYVGAAGLDEVSIPLWACQSGENTCGHETGEDKFGGVEALFKLNDSDYLAIYATRNNDHPYNRQYYAVRSTPKVRPLADQAPPARTDALLGCSAALPAPSMLERTIAEIVACSIRVGGDGRHPTDPNVELGPTLIQKFLVEEWHKATGPEQTEFLERFAREGCDGFEVTRDVYPAHNPNAQAMHECGPADNWSSCGCQANVLRIYGGTVDCEALGLECIDGLTPQCGPALECPLSDSHAPCQGDVLLYSVFSSMRHIDCRALGMTCLESMATRYPRGACVKP